MFSRTQCERSRGISILFFNAPIANASHESKSLQLRRSPNSDECDHANNTLLKCPHGDHMDEKSGPLMAPQFFFGLRGGGEGGNRPLPTFNFNINLGLPDPLINGSTDACLFMARSVSGVLSAFLFLLALSVAFRCNPGRSPLATETAGLIVLLRSEACRIKGMSSSPESTDSFRAVGVPFVKDCLA
jgi:hypothetical protein